MTKDNLKNWLNSIKVALKDLESQDLGYPVGVNEIRERIESNHDCLPPELELLYANFDGFSLPDVYNGYFIDTAIRTASASKRGEPEYIKGLKKIPIKVFGSDGGGGRFALDLHDGGVYYLPSSGAVEDGVYLLGSKASVPKVASSMSVFLAYLKEDIEAFVRDDPNHKYIAQK
jgi:hypothetical protein